MPSTSPPAGATPAGLRSSTASFPDLAASGRNEWWRYLLGILAVLLVGGAANAIVFLLVIPGLAAATGGLGAAFALPALAGAVERVERLVVGGIGADPALGDVEALAAFLLLILPFALFLAGVLPVLARIHRRPRRTFLTARRRFGWPGFLASLAAALGLMPVTFLPEALLSPESFELVFQPSRYLLFLPFVLAFVPVQGLAEEVLFRGYLLQGVARITRSEGLRLVVPAAVFTLAHLPNPEVGYGGVGAVLEYALLGLYLTFLAVRGNGLEVAAGFHAGVNLFLFSGIGSEASIHVTPTLLFVHAPEFRFALPFFLLFCALHYLVVFRLAPAGARA